jgi:hypothetical protein
MMRGLRSRVGTRRKMCHSAISSTTYSCHYLHGRTVTPYLYETTRCYVQNNSKLNGHCQETFNLTLKV